MITKIDKKIVGYKVLVEDTVKKLQDPMHEGVERGDVLDGCTYKFRNPLKDFSVYVTINNKSIDGLLYPYEIFLNCKDPEAAQWVFALTRLISGVFRKGGDVTYLPDALIEIHDPKSGSHVKKGVGFVHSDVAEIGLILKKHLEFLDNANRVEAV